MAKFKVGDRVKSPTNPLNGNPDEVMVVVGIDYPSIYPLLCKSLDKDDFGPYRESELELAEEPEKQNILQEADSLTAGDRGADYGHPLDDYAKTGMIWGALLHKWSKESAASNHPIPVPPELACLMMVGVKLSREVNKHKRDNLVDGCGYLRCVEMIHERKGHAPPT